MRSPTLILVVIATLVGGSGCKERSVKPTEFSSHALANQALLKQAAELDNQVLMRMFLDSFEKETQATNVMTRFTRNFNEAIVTKLQAETPGELRRRLETLERETNRHPFTEEQLEEALRRKER